MPTKRLFKWLTGAVVLLVLIAANVSIYQKEQVLKSGTVVILALAPVDPRSLMQGDYMALDYALTRPLQQEIYQQCQQTVRDCIAESGKIVVALDGQQHAVHAAFYQGQALQAQEVLMQYHLSASSLKIGTPSYFFQEGHAERFAAARYGEFRVARDGTALLTYLLDAQGKRIEP